MVAGQDRIMSMKGVLGLCQKEYSKLLMMVGELSRLFVGRCGKAG